MDKNQISRYSKDELELIKSSFGGDGEKVLYAIRDVLLQFPLTEEAGEIIEKLEEDVLAILRKFILPTLDPDIPIGDGLQSDMYFSIRDIRNVPAENAYTYIASVDLMIKYLVQRFDVLESSGAGEMINLVGLGHDINKTAEERIVNMMTYQSLVSYIGSSLGRLKTIADVKEETEEDKTKRLKANSSK